MTATSAWFGEEFNKLHSKIQSIHLYGGTLSGDVAMYHGSGLSEFIGRRLARKLGVPQVANSHLEVTIEHKDNELHWSRCFNHEEVFKSVFVPIGDKKTGFWIEKTGSLQLYLTVDIKNKGWYWRPLKARYKGVILPSFLLPQMVAYKTIESDQYRFHVSFSVLFLGTILSYGGLLSLSENGVI